MTFFDIIENIFERTTQWNVQRFSHKIGSIDMF